MLNKEELEQTIKFIFSREQPVGGFSFAGQMTPTLEDSYYAIRALQLIEAEIKRKIPIKKETIAFIKRNSEDNIVDYKLQYWNYWLCERFKINIKQQNKNNTIPTKNFEQLYYYILLGGAKNTDNQLLNKSLDELEYVSDMAYMVLIKKKLKFKFEEAGFIEKIQAVQNQDGGFGFNEGSTSFLENTYLAVKALNTMKSKPLLIKECINLIEGSRANNGGYGRSIWTVPTLQGTYMAMKCLLILDIK